MRRATAWLACALALATAHPGEAAPSFPPVHSDVAEYLPMADGTRVAMNLYFPGHAPPAAKAPVILMQTRYGRGGQIRGPDANDQASFWLDAGYVVAVVDTRGSTSSFGPRIADIAPDEVADMDVLIAHLASRPWSNGQVIAYGFSYLADTADWAATRHAPALVASIPREVDFDLYRDLFNPGGVANDWFLQTWGGATRDMDLGRSPDGKLDCLARAEDCPGLFPTLQPVDADRDFVLLRQALAGRRRWTPADYAHSEFRDDPGAGGRPLVSASTSTAVTALRREAKPTYSGASWMDAGTAQGALARWRSAPDVPMELWITADDHSHRTGADTLRPADRTPRPSIPQQVADITGFAARARLGQATTRMIHYYVMGADRFDSTPVWPPHDVTIRRLALQPGHALGEPGGRPSEDRYEVDFTATTGETTRWSTQFGIPPDYPDRREEDRKLLVYDGAPMERDVEVVGAPVVTLQLASSTVDPAVFVYLEDVAPDGRVAYLTEGEFRAVNRKPAAPGSSFYDEGPAAHSFRRADARPMVPGRTAELRFPLLPTAARIRKGHRLRVAIAGADAKVFRRYPAVGPATFTLRVGGPRASTLDLPLRPAHDE